MIRLVLKLTAFTLVCLGFTLWLAFTIGNVQSVRLAGLQLWGDERDTYRATFDDVTGLLVGDNVKIAGVVVGQVSGISVEEGRAVVEFKVDQDVAIPSDSETAVRWRNLLGQRYLYLYPGSSSDAAAAGTHFPVEQARPIVDLGELFNRLGPLIQAVDPEQVNEFLVAFTGALEDGNDALLGATIGDLATTVDALASRDEAISRLVTNLDTLTGALADRDEQLRTILDNVTTLAASFADNTDVIEATVDDLGEFSETFGRLISENRPGIDRIIVRVADIVDVVGGRIDTLERTVASLDDTGLSLWNASRYGEWLNQFIPCIVTDVDGPEGPLPTIRDDAACEPQSSTAGTPASGSPPHHVADILTAALGVEG